MQKSDERIILFLDFELKMVTRKYRGFAPKNSSDLVAFLEEMQTKGQAIKKNRNETEAYYISDIDTSKSNYVTLLINRSDKRAADPAFSNPDKKTRRVINKRSGEGQDYSSHVVWYLDEDPKRPNFYKVLFEVAPGLTTSKLQSFLNNLFKLYSKLNANKFKVKDPDGSGKELRAWPSITIHGHLCENFKKELANGKIEDIEIYTETQKMTPWDSHAYTKIHEKAVKIKLNKDKLLPANTNLLREVFKSAKQDYEYARVRYKSEDDINRSVCMLTQSFSVAKDFKLIKKKKITDFDKPLDMSYDEINVSIQDKMLQSA